MTMNRSNIIALALLLSGAPLLAQNINHSVQVTNDYNSEFADFPKLGVQPRQVDSLYSFDYRFDYSVFDSPYRGSYEFTPYEIQVTPDPMGYDGENFYLKAGAGYTLHPVLDLVWIPVQTERFALGVYNFGSGYAGRYVSSTLDSGRSAADGSGYDFSDSFGMGGSYLMKKAKFSFDLGYDGIFAGHPAVDNSSYNSAFLKLGITARDPGKTFFDYDVQLKYRFGGLNSAAPSSDMYDNYFALSGFIGPVIKKAFGLFIDYNFELDALNWSSGDYNRSFEHAQVTPRLAFTAGIFDLDVGVVLDYFKESGTSLRVAPKVEASMKMFSGTTKLYAGVTGGRRLNTLYSLKSMYHFYVPGSDDAGAMTEKLGAHIGLQGRLGSYFQYDLKGGYSSMLDMPLEGFLNLEFADINLTYVKLGLQWVSERFNLDGDLRYCHTNLAGAVEAFAPAEFTTDFRASYNWYKRVYLGVDVNSASSRKALDLSGDVIDAYCDLGIWAEYGLSSKFGIWLETGNLLFQKIQEHPGYVIDSPYVTLGIRLKM